MKVENVHGGLCTHATECFLNLFGSTSQIQAVEKPIEGVLVAGWTNRHTRADIEAFYFWWGFFLKPWNICCMAPPWGQQLAPASDPKEQNLLEAKPNSPQRKNSTVFLFRGVNNTLTGKTASLSPTSTAQSHMKRMVSLSVVTEGSKWQSLFPFTSWVFPERRSSFTFEPSKHTDIDSC